MPFYKKIELNNSTNIYVWKITEDFDTIFKETPLRDVSLARLEKMLSKTHQCGFLSVRHLLKQAGYSDFDLIYDENGKPNLKDGKHISITHSFGFSAIIISNENVGIDLEMNREKIIRIADKFIDSEFDYLDKQNQYIEQLSVIWGAKEALYKMCNSRSLSFKQDMHVYPFNLNSEILTAHIDSKQLNFNKNFHLHFESFENYTLVYGLENNE
ncbi:4'-phosphopantetheinyl transferase superfamily protein [Paenimyroides tangerinum]|uniref:4'-phosphopantetheinyl transferase superfamily protein n=1 Tax=Paenimyroides tangerinum TaxID=2488728 RepID=A0A3P3W8I0_9FLAO|nr:4'-phosphopantetheinyl transferase superfamily protein [Paenimyroides tangerinum]RRJ88953.1 4'-phosphopantetheinyl transferase superfamily protein [Paenimyroides tangerinum]RRJ92329.1 4'-phosphopantetheinyl transferase superfamily protein [Paenimyroides tangerinum]